MLTDHRPHDLGPARRRKAARAGLGLLWALSLGAAAAEPPLPPGWIVSTDGATLIHRSTKTVWSRCAEGMTWDGQSCTGRPQRLTHAEAIQRARERAEADGVGWRLPRVPELQRLAGQTQITPPADWYWSGTANLVSRKENPYRYDNIMRGIGGGNSTQLAYLHGWAVYSGTGEARGDVARRTHLAVRLVHSLP